MPIRIPEDLPAADTLAAEGIPIIGERDAIHQDIRPMRIALLNLMPEKIKTETQMARLLGSTPLQVELTLLRTSTYLPKNTSAEHLLAFYQTFEEVADTRFDGLIVTGAPVETLPFEKVDYWLELTGIFDWSMDHVFRSFNICWGAQAALHYRFGIEKVLLPRKEFGIYLQTNRAPTNALMRGMTDVFPVPVSRHTSVPASEIRPHEDLEILADNPTAGICLLQDRVTGDVHMFNHLEYDTTTLADEFHRDRGRNKRIDVPANYFPGDDPNHAPANTWRSHAHLLFGNWINDLYQNTPFDLGRLTNRGRKLRAAS